MKMARPEFDKYLARMGSKKTKLKQIMNQAAYYPHYKFIKTNVDDPKRAAFVKELVRAGYLYQVGSKYEIPDPLLLYSFLNQ